MKTYLQNQYDLYRVSLKKEDELKAVGHYEVA